VASYLDPSSARAGPWFVPDAPFRTTGDEVEPTSLGGENERRPSIPIADVHDFDSRKHAAWRELQLVSLMNWRNRPVAVFRPWGLSVGTSTESSPSPVAVELVG